MLFCGECAVDFDRTGMVVLTVITIGDYESQMIINYAMGRNQQRSNRRIFRRLLNRNLQITPN